VNWKLQETVLLLAKKINNDSS